MTKLIGTAVGYTVVCCSIALLTGAAQRGTTSALWGSGGERWDGPDRRLPDWSYAGYKGYEDPLPEIPDVPVWKDITKAPYNADNTGVRDVSDVVLRAINDYKPGNAPRALYFPTGTYKLSKFIRIQKSNLVLRGDGMGRTVFRFTQGVLACDINLMDRYTGPGMIHFAGGDVNALHRTHRRVAVVTASLRRGDRDVPVSSTSGLTGGDWVLLQWDHEPGGVEDAGSLENMFVPEYRTDLWDEYVNHAAVDQKQPYKYFPCGLIVWMVKIKSLSPGRITLARGLPFRTSPKNGARGWDTVVRQVNGNEFLTGVGVEDLTIDFPDFVKQKNRKGVPGFWHNEKSWYDADGNRYDAEGPGRIWFHDFRDGHDAVSFYSVIDSWIRRVEFIDCDGPVILKNARHVTVRDVVFRREDKHGAPIGHFGMRMSYYSHDVLLENIAFAGADYEHDLGTQTCNNCVYSNCTSTHDFECDMHGHVYACLYTQIHTTSGNIDAGNALQKPNGAFNTFWNLVSDNGGYTNRWGPFFGVRHLSGNLIGINSKDLETLNTDRTGRESEVWVEKWNGSDTVPANLYQAQRAHRTGRRE